MAHKNAPKVQVAARERAFEILDEVGEEIIFGKVSDGATQTALAEEYDVSRYLLREWISDTDERRRRYEEAWRQSADAYAEEALEIADQKGRDTTGMVARDKLRVQTRKWSAERRDPQRYGNLSKIEVAGSAELGAGLLAALMDYGNPESPGMRRLAERGELDEATTRKVLGGELEDETPSDEEAVEADYEMVVEDE